MENRLTKVSRSDSTVVATFAYDALGRRIETVDAIAGITKRYYYDDQRVAVQTAVVGAVETDQRYFVFGNTIDEVLVMRNLTGSPADTYYTHDHLYSPVALFLMNGAVVERYEYDAYGQVTIWNAAFTTTYTASQYGNPYTFTGRELDVLDNNALLLYYYRARTYDPETGRFMQKDPLGINPAGGRINSFSIHTQYTDGANLFAYVMNNPVNFYDAYGTSTGGEIIFPIIGAAAICVAPHAVWWHAIAEQNNDKYAHCVVSCRVSKSCGHLMSLVAGHGKELRDEIALRLGYDDIGWDPEDIVANSAGRKCAGWISWIPNPITWGIQCFRKSCNECCADNGYRNE